MIALIVQARMGSTRLPGKTSRPILGKPMLEWELERLRRSQRVDVFFVATSERPEDAVVEEIAKASQWQCFRGSENDVLDRYYQAAKEAKADVVVRVSGDCPLQDPGVIDEVVDRYIKTGADYAKQPENYPEGLDTEVFSFAALEVSAKEARLPSEREHVTLFICNHPERFKIDQWKKGDVDSSNMHWSVDTKADFAFVTKVYEHFGARAFHMRDVIDFLNTNTELLEINRGGTGYEGLAKSLRDDELFKRRHA